jgi:hypothetical protein
MRAILIPTLALLLASCGRSAETPANNAAAGEPYGNRVEALPEAQQKAVFLRAIRDSGEDCQLVTEAARGGTYRGMPVWQARCRGGGRGTFVSADDGTAEILNANQARLVTDQPAANASEDAR